jgi:hypothetical protein
LLRRGRDDVNPTWNAPFIGFRTNSIQCSSEFRMLKPADEQHDD